METALINEELFKENSPVKEDTVISKFVPYIILVQKLYIEKILGKPLTDELKVQVQTDTLTPANKALILKIAPSLSFYAVYQGLPFHWASVVNKGVTLRNSENSDATTLKDIAQLKRWIKDDAEEFARDLIEYLCECKDTYPLWKPTRGCGCCPEDTGRDVIPFDAGIFIPKR
jgi:hypothetical protein